MLIILNIGVLSAFLAMFINYIIGKPGSKEFSVYEIFSSYSIWLAKRRLKQVDLYSTYANQYNDNLKRINTKHELINLRNDFKKIIYDAAEPYFTWERAFGMCIICNSFWVSLISGLFFTQNIISLVSIIVTSHVAIRILNKFL